MVQSFEQQVIAWRPFTWNVVVVITDQLARPAPLRKSYWPLSWDNHGKSTMSSNYRNKLMMIEVLIMKKYKKISKAKTFTV